MDTCEGKVDLKEEDTSTAGLRTGHRVRLSIEILGPKLKLKRTVTPCGAVLQQSEHIVFCVSLCIAYNLHLVFFNYSMAQYLLFYF